MACHSALYVVFNMPRSGSTWFTELAMGARTLGTPQEWFNVDFIEGDTSHLDCAPPKARKIAEINAYLQAICDEGTGAAGLQLSYYQALALRDLLSADLPVKAIHWFYLRRRDILEQAISFYKSIQTGLWHSYQLSDPGQRAPEFRFAPDECREQLHRLIRMEADFEDLMRLCDIRPNRMYYEDLLQDPLAALQAFGQVIGRPAPSRLPSTRLKVLRDDQTRDWKAALATAPGVQDLLARRSPLI
jgi:LPS sulfotransferase NodH